MKVTTAPQIRQKAARLKAEPGVARYLSIATTIKGWIQSGRYRAGDAISTVDELAREFGVARGTIQEALRALVEQEVILTSRGKRSTVARGAQLRPVFGPIDARELLFVEKTGKDPAHLIGHSAVEADKELRRIFELADKALIRECHLVFDLNDRPNAYVVAHIPLGDAISPTAQQILHTLQTEMDSAARSERRMAAMTADMEIAKHLMVPLGTPILRYSCAFWRSDRALGAYYTAYLRSDDCEYRLDV